MERAAVPPQTVTLHPTSPFCPPSQRNWRVRGRPSNGGAKCLQRVQGAQPPDVNSLAH
ncbi:hypothetical protein RvY_02262 [Ramazzottius varieornatus]|uniref:Uncharacterized protein n=1 Tax=Ramazzottius varieornatus TaxID=947166 RepID=A0A1D1UJX2_RAMVA|nr:hypothetical protein RvY_02262 [Ramazzottius varieornatus]